MFRTWAPLQSSQARLWLHHKISQGCHGGHRMSPKRSLALASLSMRSEWPRRKATNGLEGNRVEKTHQTADSIHTLSKSQEKWKNWAVPLLAHSRAVLVVFLYQRREIVDHCGDAESRQLGQLTRLQRDRCSMFPRVWTISLGKKTGSTSNWFVQEIYGNDITVCRMVQIRKDFSKPAVIVLIGQF